jgi:hypothetical protein
MTATMHQTDAAVVLEPGAHTSPGELLPADLSAGARRAP